MQDKSSTEEKARGYIDQISRQNRLTLSQRQLSSAVASYSTRILYTRDSYLKSLADNGFVAADAAFAFPCEKKSVSEITAITAHIPNIAYYKGHVRDAEKQVVEAVFVVGCKPIPESNEWYQAALGVCAIAILSFAFSLKST